MYQVNLGSNQSVHLLGVSYLSNFLDRVGCTILEMNTDPNHHFQLLTRVNKKSLLIAVRTAHHPGIGAIDQSTLENLIRESAKRDALPHFAGLSVMPITNNEIDKNGSINGQEYQVIFNGISAVR